MWHEWERGAVRTRFWGGDLKETDHLEDLDVAGRIIRVIKRSVDQTNVSQERDRVACCCEHGNEPTGSNIHRTFPD